MTKRQPLQWFNVTDGSDGLIPGCDTCAERYLDPMFMEAVCSVALERGSEPAGLARRVIDQFHANRHREDP